MNTSTPIGFGIVGAGMIADFHARAIAHATGARLAGVAARSPESTRAFAEKHGIPFWTTRVEDLVARRDIQVVCITTPSGAHLEPALAAARAGKHLIVEKPIEINLERADALLVGARDAGVRVGAIFQARFGGGARAVKAALDSGRFGRLVLASGYVKWHRAAAYYTGWKGTLDLDGGGAVINQGIHAIDLLQWFAGMPAEIAAFKTRRVHEKIHAEDTATAAIRFAGGALGSFEATTAAWPGWSRRIELCGEKGSVVLEDDTPVRWEFRDPLPEDEAIRSAKPNAGMKSGASAPGAMTHEGHQRQIEDMIGALRDNRPLAVDGSEARKAVAFVRAIYDSAESGKPVAL